MTRKIQLPAQFPFFQTYSNALAAIPDDEDRARLALAIVEYGAWGKEPDFGTRWGIAAAFEAMRINLDNSAKRSIAGKKGGSKKKKCEEEVSPEQIKKLAKAMEVCYEPVQDEALAEAAAFMDSELEREREILRAETELVEWMC